MNNIVYVVGQEHFIHDYIYKPVKVFLNERDAREWCEKHNEHNLNDGPYIYEKFIVE